MSNIYIWLYFTYAFIQALFLGYYEPSKYDKFPVFWASFTFAPIASLFLTILLLNKAIGFLIGFEED